MFNIKDLDNSLRESMPYHMVIRIMKITLKIHTHTLSKNCMSGLAIRM